MFRDLPHMVWISPSVTMQLELLLKAYIRNQFFMSTPIICLTLFCCWTYFWFIVSCVIIPSSSIARAYAKTAVHIMIAYGTLLVANTRYISLIIIPITILVFIGALFVKVSVKGSLNYNKDNNNEGHKADDVAARSESADCSRNCNDDGNNKASKAYGSGASSKADNNGGSGIKYNDGLNATAVLPVCVLFLMAYFNVDNMVVSQFLLFLTSTLGELTLSIARLPSEVWPAFRVIRRASLVVVLVTAHTMAAELLGDEVVLACTPELIAVLLWFSIYFVHGGGFAAVSVDKVTSRKAGIIVLSTGMAVLAYLPVSIDESAAWYLVCCAFSVILLYLWVFTLREWPTAAMPPSELEGAIQLLSFCRDTMLTTAAALFLVVTLLLDGRLGLQELFGDKAVNKFLYSRER